MPAPQFIGPLQTEAFRKPGGRGGRNMSAADLRRVERENSPNVGGGDQGAATERAARLERRIAAIDAMEARANAKKGQGVRTRGLSKKLRDERDRSTEALAGLRSGRETALAERARRERSSAARKSKAAAKKAGQNVVAGGTKRAANVAKTGKKAAAAPKKAAKKTAAAPKKAAKKAGNPVAKKPRAPRTPAQREARNARERAARAAKRAGG